MNNLCKDHPQSSSCIVRYTAKPIAVPAVYEAIQRRGCIRNAGVLLGICHDYVGSGADMAGRSGDQVAFSLTKARVAEASKKHTKTDQKKVKLELQKAQAKLTATDTVKLLAQALKVFINAAHTIEQKNGKVTLDVQQLLDHLRTGRKEFPDDSLLASLCQKLSTSHRGTSDVRDVTDLFQEIKASGKLPTPTAKAFEIFRLANDDNTSISDISAVVETDPAIVTRILKAANSAFYKSLNPVRSVQDAITRLGLAMLKKIALGSSLITDNKKGFCLEFDYELFWSESLARAIAARNLNHIKSNAFNADEAFTVGMLCQIGRLAFASVYPEKYSAILKHTDAGDPIQLTENERKVFGIGHNELAAEMMSDWNLPDIFCQAVRFQDSFEDHKNLVPGSPEYELAGTLQWPAKISTILTQSQIKLSFLKSIINDAGQLGAGPDFFGEKFDAIVNEWTDMGTILEVKTRKVLPWKEIHTRIN